MYWNSEYIFVVQAIRITCNMSMDKFKIIFITLLRGFLMLPSTCQRHIEEAAIVMYMYLYSLAFMDHQCTLGALSVTTLYTAHGTSSMS